MCLTIKLRTCICGHQHFNHDANVKYTSQHIMEEIEHELLDKVYVSPMYSIMIDETTDVSILKRRVFCCMPSWPLINNEQFTIVYKKNLTKNPVYAQNYPLPQQTQSYLQAGDLSVSQMEGGCLRGNVAPIPRAN